MLEAPISPLHDCKLGPVNHVVSALEDEIEDDSLKNYMKDLNIVKEEYFHKLEGNECSKVLKNLEKLREDIPVELFPFIDTLESLGVTIILQIAFTAPTKPSSI